MDALFILAGTLAFGVFCGAAVNWIQLRRLLRRDVGSLRQQVTDARKEVETIAEEWRRKDRDEPGPSVPLNGFNLNRRAEAVRRLSAGHPANRVAAGTGWSIAEVELLRKVENLTSKIKQERA